MFPRVMISSTNPAWSLTIYNASSSQYTLTVMSIVALIFVPIVLAYQGWTYYMFRKRVTTTSRVAGLLDCPALVSPRRYLDRYRNLRGVSVRLSTDRPKICTAACCSLHAIPDLP